MPQGGPQCREGSPGLCTLIVGVPSTEMPWKGVPISHDAQGTPALYDTNVCRAVATWGTASVPMRAACERPLTSRRVQTSMTMPSVKHPLPHSCGTPEALCVRCGAAQGHSMVVNPSIHHPLGRGEDHFVVLFQQVLGKG